MARARTDRNAEMLSMAPPAADRLSRMRRARKARTTGNRPGASMAASGCAHRRERSAPHPGAAGESPAGRCPSMAVGRRRHGACGLLDADAAHERGLPGATVALDGYSAAPAAWTITMQDVALFPAFVCAPAMLAFLAAVPQGDHAYH